MVDKSVCKCKKKMCEKGNGGYEKEKFVLLSWKKNKKNEKGVKKKKRKKKKKSGHKTRSTNNQNWDEFGEFYVSWKKILWKSDYDEMLSFISRYLNSFIPFFQSIKHLNPWPHYKL